MKGKMIMPYVNVKITKRLGEDEKQSFYQNVAEKMVLLPGKNKSNTMIHIEDDCTIIKNDNENCAFVDVRLYKASPEEEKNAFCIAISDIICEYCKTERQNIYINMVELDNWGSGTGWR